MTQMGMGAVLAAALALYCATPPPPDGLAAGVVRLMDLGADAAEDSPASGALAVSAATLLIEARRSTRAVRKLRNALEIYERELAPGVANWRLKRTRSGLERLGVQLTESSVPRAADVPSVRLPPAYPPQALNQGIEGWVLVEFGIRADGRVVDPFVVDSDPPGVFDASALAAVEQWRYPPPPEPREHVSTLITFELQRGGEP